MTTSVSTCQIQAQLAKTGGFEQLGVNALQQLAQKCQLERYRIGQPLLVRENIPAMVTIIYQGQARLLGHDQRTQLPVSLQLVGPGEVLGWVGLIRGIACETAIASTEVVGINLPSADFLACMEAEPAFAKDLQQRCALSEVFELLSLELQRRADAQAELKELAVQVWQEAVVLNLPPGRLISELDCDRLWLVSSGAVGDFAAGSRLSLNRSGQSLRVEGTRGARLLGLRSLQLPVTPAIAELELLDLSLIPYASDQPPTSPSEPLAPHPKYPYVRGRGLIDAPLACFGMLSQYTGVSFRRDMIRKVLENQVKTAGRVSLPACGAIAEMMGLSAQLVKVPASGIHRLKAPVLIRYFDSFAILYSISERELLLARPEVGIVCQQPGDLAKAWGDGGQVLLLQPRAEQRQEKFSLRWFLPAIYRYRRVLTEVLVAAFFVQLFGLANPLMTQVIIDKVLIQGSRDTLKCFGNLFAGSGCV